MFGSSSRHRRVAWTTVVFSLALASANPTWAASGATFPLRSDAATRTLVGADGRPFLITGDAAWSIVVQLTREEVQQYLNDRQARGFNTLLVNLIEHFYSAAPPANRYGQQPFLTAGNFSTPNEAYFAHADWVIDQAAQRGMLVLLAPMYLGNGGNIEGWYGELKANGLAKCRQYGRYVGQRYARFANIVWVNGGDAPPLNGLAEIEEIIAGIKEYDTAHIHMAHSRRDRSALDDYDRPWLDVNTTYTDDLDCSGAVTSSRADYLRARPLTFFHIEGWYENEGAPASCLLSQMYHPVLTGARGHVFGNRPVWLFDPGWQQALDSPGSRYMTHSAALFRSREGWGLAPDIDRRIVVSGGGNPDGTDFAAAARTPSGKSVLVYVPTARTVGVDTTQVPGASFVAWWFNPTSGAAQQIGTYARGGSRSFTTPAGSPWVLVLDDASAGLPAPGSVLPPDAPLGRSNVLWHHQGTGSLYLWFMNGAAQTGGTLLSPSGVSDTQWQIRGTADFGGDGQNDVLWHHQGTGDLYVWTMNGATQTGGSYLSPARVPDTQWQVRGLADFSGDGKNDILWQHQGTGDLYLWTMSSTTLTGGAFLSPARVSDTQWRVVGVSDFNGDGKADLLWHHQGTGDVGVWFMNGTVLTGWASLGRVPSVQWQIRQVGDFNADGKPDILWHHQAAGTLYVWYLNGTAPAGGSYLSPSAVPDTSWIVAQR